MHHVRWNPVDPVRTHSRAVTRGIRVECESFFVPERSMPQDDVYFFAYRIKITNEGLETATLRSRRWIITAGSGLVHKVEGPGVVGEEPRLTPGESFEYTSSCPLSTCTGMMRGVFVMESEEGERFEARVAEFALLTPGILN